MVGDNPLNKEKWKVHGTMAEYWRSDNPYIAGWYRFGDDEYPISNTLGQPARCDSGPRHHHLATNQALGTYIQYVSGIAPWPGVQASNSGVQITSANWTEAGGTTRALRLDSDYFRERTDGTSLLGYYGQGSAITSGVTMMGWMQIPASQTNLGEDRKVWANIEQTVTADNDGEWEILFDPDTRHISLTYHAIGPATTPAGRVQTVSSLAHPNGRFPVDEPTFFVCQINKGNPATAIEVGAGSGLLRLWLGTHVSGLQEVGAHEITVAGANFWRGERSMTNNTSFPYTFFTDPRCARGDNETSNLPPSSIFDEFIILNDGNLKRDYLEHYMNSGIIQDEQDPLGLGETFVPELPGTDDLIAYWTFDEQGGANTSPNTPAFTNLDMVLNGVSFVDGVRGGSGIRPNKFIGTYNSALSDFPTNKTGLAHVIAGSGLNFLFPEKDQTWIGWVRSEGASDLGGAFGWQGSSDRHSLCYWQDYIFAAGSSRPGQIDLGMTPSGGPATRVASIAGSSTAGNPNQARNLEAGNWHLLALVWDITHGFTRVVVDAHDVYPMHMNGLSMWGATNEHLTTLGPDGAGFVLSNSSITDRSSYDDWAVYDRVLSLPEMSGYALSGVDVTPVVSPIDTSHKRTMGYWKLDEEEIYDPEVVSGVRYPDSSWYRHHLTNVSGHFEQGSFLNDNIALTTASVAHSGSIMAVNQLESGSNLDFSTSGVWGSSGMTAGCWMYVPSGDIGTQGNGSSGLVGDKMFMGVWGQSIDDQSWMLGMRDNKLFGAAQIDGIGAVSEVESSSGVPFNTPFFAAMKVVPSGANTLLEVFISEEANDPLDLQLVGRATSLPYGTNLAAGGLSGFSLFGAAERQFGFPSGTRMQMPFVFAGSLIESDLGLVKVAGVTDTVLASGGVSVDDPSNISHWRFDNRGAQVQDVGQAQNALTLVNTDGNELGIFEAVHTSGVVVRRTEYLTTQTDSSTSGLDLATDNKSWTFLTWIKPNADTTVGEAPILGKGGPASGVEVLMTDSTFNPSARASGITTQAYNGALAPGEWNHLAIVYDRDNDEFTTIVNGRYAGPQLNPLVDVPPNSSGMALGGRGDQENLALFGGPQFSGMLDDSMLFSRALTLPEISGLAANSYNFAESSGILTELPVGGYVFGIAQNLVSGLIGSFLHGQAQDLELIAGYISGVSGVLGEIGGFIHGKAQVSGVVGSWLHGAGQQSGVFGHFVHGMNQVSGFIGSYSFGACEASSEFDIVLNFNVIAFDEFDARLGVEKTRIYDFDARLGVIRITQPPDCTLEMPAVGTIVSGLPYDLTVTGSGIASDDKDVSKVRFTFADFKGAEEGVLISGEANSGLYQATRQFDTVGWYTVKIEVLDSYGYRTSCCRPFLLLPSGTPSGTFINSLPGISITGTPTTGSAIHTASFTHSISGLSTTSGVLEYTDFADQQESLVNSLEMPSGTQFVNFVRRHDYTMPGRYCAVWAASGDFGIVSDTIAGGIDYLT